MEKIKYIALLAVALTVLSANAVEVEYFYLSDPALVEISPDLEGLLLNLGRTVPTRNPDGNASVYRFEPLRTVKGFLGGSFTVDGPFADPSAAGAGFGSYVSDIATIDVVGTNHCFPRVCGSLLSNGFTAGIGDPLAQSLTINDNHTYALTLQSVITSVSGAVNPVTPTVGAVITSTTTGTDLGHGLWIANGEDPNVVFAGMPDIIDNFEQLLALAPANFQTLFWNRFEFSVDEGGTGFGSTVFYSLIPIPPAVLMMSSGLVVLLMRRPRGAS